MGKVGWIVFGVVVLIVVVAALVFQLGRAQGAKDTIEGEFNVVGGLLKKLF